MAEQKSNSGAEIPDRCEISLFVDREIEKLLADNRIDLVSLLRRNDLEVESGVALHAQAGHGEKEPVSVIIATAALITALTPAISRVLENLSQKPVSVEELVAVPVEDTSGRIVRDAEGNPMIEWITRVRLVERQARSVSESYEISGPLGLKISFKRSSGGVR